jgi:SAM-dependent methyltransferase
MPFVPRLVRLLGRYSEGLRLSAHHGPTSGEVLEYVVRNLPQGTGAVGRLIDRRFLRLRTWEGTRQRSHTTKALVAEMLRRRRAAGRTTMVLDVGSATAPYLRELVRECGGEDLIVDCRDRDPRQVTLGRQLVAAEGLPRFKFSVGDAADQASYLTNRDPDVLLAIHLLPLFHRDEVVRSVVRLAYDHLSPSGCFICTTLTQRPAGLRYWSTDAFRMLPTPRQPELVAAWLREAGFVHIDQRFSQAHAFALIGWKAG